MKAGEQRAEQEIEPTSRNCCTYGMEHAAHVLSYCMPILIPREELRVRTMKRVQLHCTTLHLLHCTCFYNSL